MIKLSAFRKGKYKRPHCVFVCKLLYLIRQHRGNEYVKVLLDILYSTPGCVRLLASTFVSHPCSPGDLQRKYLGL